MRKNNRLFAGHYMDANTFSGVYYIWDMNQNKYYEISCIKIDNFKDSHEFINLLDFIKANSNECDSISHDLRWYDFETFFYNVFYNGEAIHLNFKREETSDRYIKQRLLEMGATNGTPFQIKSMTTPKINVEINENEVTLQAKTTLIEIDNIFISTSDKIYMIKEMLIKNNPENDTVYLYVVSTETFPSNTKSILRVRWVKESDTSIDNSF